MLSAADSGLGNLVISHRHLWGVCPVPNFRDELPINLSLCPNGKLKYLSFYFRLFDTSALSPIVWAAHSIDIHPRQSNTYVTCKAVHS